MNSAFLNDTGVVDLVMINHRIPIAFISFQRHTMEGHTNRDL